MYTRVQFKEMPIVKHLEREYVILIRCGNKSKEEEKAGGGEQKPLGSTIATSDLE